MSRFDSLLRIARLWLALPALFLLAVVPDHARAAPLQVMNINDNFVGSLRNTISNSSAANGNTIIFAPGVTGTITLASELLISKDITIIGPGAKNLTISGNMAVRVFDITSGTVNLSGLSIADGFSAVEGGGITNTGTLAISSCAIINNKSRGGSGIYQLSGQVTISNCTLARNSTSLGGEGGAVFIHDGQSTLDNCTLSGNTAGGIGGGGEGGGVFIRAGQSKISNCTLSGNTAAGGGIGGGIFIAAGDSAEIGSSIIAGNSFGPGGLHPDVDGVVTSDGYNLIGTRDGNTGFTSMGDQLGPSAPAAPLAPGLGTLQNNGGPTQSMGLLPGSPAIDAGFNTAGLTTDGRGFPRTFDMPNVPNGNGSDGTDIGAYELRPSDHADFNGDSFPDLVLQSSAAQRVAIWFNMGPNVLAGAYALSGSNPITLPPNWQIAGVGDFNGDGWPDIVLQNTVNGQIAFWFTYGNNIIAGAYATFNGSPVTLPSGWQIVGVGDFNGDSLPDLALDNPATGQIALWYANGTNITAGAYVASGGAPAVLPSGWQIGGVGDFNGDGNPDLVLDNPASGQIAFWLMAGGSVTSGAYALSGGAPLNLPSGWQIAGVGDYNGDGYQDLILQNLNNRQLAFWYFNGAALSGSSYALTGGSPTALPTSWQVSGPR